ncbi:GNAT family N-acetyltransferase [Streptomyces sp. NPDC055013]
MPHADIRPTSHPHPHPDLHGHGLRLRPWDPESEADAATWFRGRSDPEFRRWNTPLSIGTDPDSALESLRDSARSTREGTSVSYCVTDASTGTPFGHIGVNVIDWVMRSARVGYWVLPETRGRRVATHALSLVTRWALAEPGLGLYRLELGHALGHDSSCRIAERCGYRYEGTLRGAMWEAGRQDAYRDVHLHARLATDPDRAPHPN